MKECSQLRVDIRNPIHVFACLGCLEIAEKLRWQEGSSELVLSRFVPGEDLFVMNYPLDTVLRFLKTIEIKPVVPGDAMDGDKKQAGKALPVRIVSSYGGGISLNVTCWANGGGRPPIRFFSGNQGGSAILEQMVQCIQDWDGPPKDALYWGKVLGNPVFFRFDARSSWNNDSLGWSVDAARKHEGKPILSVVYPLAELLAVIGLEHARPSKYVGDPIVFRYRVWEDWLPGCLSRLAFEGVPLGVAVRTLEFQAFASGKGYLSANYAEEVIQ